jgi:hypothetical protein
MLLVLLCMLHGTCIFPEFDVLSFDMRLEGCRSNVLGAQAFVSELERLIRS